ncbi:MAG: CBS domain-containing protein [Bacteroidetes bacterium]|nr:CBS domain-containing protein [Bacteroidota bacterium]
MNTIRRLLNDKGDQVWSVSPSASVLDAIRLMAEKGIGALVVANGDQLLGVISERDYARQVILKGRASNSTQVSEIMSSPVHTVGPDDSVQECLALMTQKRIRHLPVVEHGRLAGVVSIGDLVRVIIDEQKFTIEQLTAYVNS